MQQSVPDRHKPHLIVMEVLHMVSLHYLWVSATPNHKSGSKRGWERKTQAANRKMKSVVLQGRHAITLHPILWHPCGKARGPLLLKTAGRWTWDTQSLSLNWQTGRTTCCNNKRRPLHMALLFSWPDCLDINSLSTSLGNCANATSGVPYQLSQ